MNHRTEMLQALPRHVIKPGIPVIDCRLADDEPTRRAEWGESLYGSEAAAYAIGLKQQRPLPLTYWEPRGVTTHRDLRADPQALGDILASLARDYRALQKRGIAVRCIAIANYGAAILAEFEGQIGERVL